MPQPDYSATILQTVEVGLDSAPLLDDNNVERLKFLPATQPTPFTQVLQLTIEGVLYSVTVVNHGEV